MKRQARSCIGDAYRLAEDEDIRTKMAQRKWHVTIHCDTYYGKAQAALKEESRKCSPGFRGSGKPLQSKGSLS